MMLNQFSITMLGLCYMYLQGSGWGPVSLLSRRQYLCITSGPGSVLGWTYATTIRRYMNM